MTVFTWKVLQSQSTRWECCITFVLHESGGNLGSNCEHQSYVRGMRAAPTKHGTQRSSRPRGTTVNNAIYRRGITNLRRGDSGGQLVFLKVAEDMSLSVTFDANIMYLYACIWQLKYVCLIEFFIILRLMQQYEMIKLLKE